MLQNSTVEGVGRGTVYLTVANLVYLVSNYAIHIGLGRYLGPAMYGTYGVVLALMSTVSLLLTTGFPQGAARYIAESRANLGSVCAGSKKLQLILAGITFALYLGLSEPIALALGDTTLIPYIRISAFVIPAYALFALYSEGYLNGLREFSKQGMAIATGSLTRMLLVFLFVSIGFEVYGAIGGYICGGIAGWLFAWLHLRHLPKDNNGLGIRPLLSFGIPATLFSFMVFLVMSIDLFAVKALVVDEDAAGFYTSASTIARVPYFLLGGLASALLPSIASAVSARDDRLVATYITQSVRYMLLFLVPAILLLHTTAGGLVSLIYGEEYTSASGPLEILLFGLAALAIFQVLAFVMMGAAKPHVAFGLGAVLVVIDIGLNLYLIPRYGLVGAAWATTITSVIGLLCACGYTLIRFRALVAPKSLLRIGAASFAVFLLAHFMSVPAGVLPIVYVALFLLYLVFLGVLGEFTGEDVNALKRIIFSKTSSLHGKS